MKPEIKQPGILSGFILHPSSFILVKSMAWIEVIEPGGATGALKDEYEQAIGRAGRVFNILKVQSLNAQTLRRSMGLYQATMHAPSGLSRTEREMLATVVSQVNGCFY